MHWVNTREKEGPKGTLKGKYKNVLKKAFDKNREKTGCVSTAGRKYLKKVNGKGL